MGSDESSIQYSSEKNSLPLISGQILISVHGASGSGKTTLINHLFRKQFNSEYIPTKQMESRQILWNSKQNPNERIRIILWDVVEVTTTSPRPVDTISRADGIVLIYDPNDMHSVDYALSILYKLPIGIANDNSKIPVLILSNFLDKRGNHLKIHPRLRNVPFPQIQVSMKTSFGLDICEKWIDRALFYNKQRSFNARYESVRKERKELEMAIRSTVEANEKELNLKSKPKPQNREKNKATKKTPLPYSVRGNISMPSLNELLQVKDDSDDGNKSNEDINKKDEKCESNNNQNRINNINDTACNENDSNKNNDETSNTDINIYHDNSSSFDDKNNIISHHNSQDNINNQHDNIVDDKESPNNEVRIDCNNKNDKENNINED